MLRFQARFADRPTSEQSLEIPDWLEWAPDAGFYARATPAWTRFPAPTSPHLAPDRSTRVGGMADALRELYQTEHPPPPPPPRTKWTRRVPHPVLIGHAASLSQVLRRRLR